MSVRSVKKLDEGARNRFSSSRLVQLLQQWQLLEPPAQWPGLGEQLGSWMGWTDAVALSAVLSGDQAQAPAPSAAAPPPTRPLAGARAALTPAQAREGVARARDSLLADIATDPLFAEALRGVAQAGTERRPVPDFAACRRQHQAHQRAMERQIGPWRDTVRALLARSTPRVPSLKPDGWDAGPAEARGAGPCRSTLAPLAALAALDSVMARALQERESYLLSRLPLAMEPHFARLCGAEASGAGAGLTLFITDLQALLRAELEFRLEPIEGMLEALNQPGLEPRHRPDHTLAELPA